LSFERHQQEMGTTPALISGSRDSIFAHSMPNALDVARQSAVAIVPPPPRDERPSAFIGAWRGRKPSTPCGLRPVALRQVKVEPSRRPSIEHSRARPIHTA
jgi:hypothetical protein